jgi:hypothetical protein
MAAWPRGRPAARTGSRARRGVAFEEVDVPGLRTVHSIAEVAGNYPSKNSSGERAAWFRDSEGNMLGIGSRCPSRSRPAA